jgi:hypothetical protein
MLSISIAPVPKHELTSDTGQARCPGPDQIHQKQGRRQPLPRRPQ